MGTFDVAIVKEKRVLTVSQFELMQMFSNEISMHLVNLKSVVQVNVKSEKYGPVIIRKGI